MSKEIKEQIDKLNLELESLIIPDSFILNPKIAVIANKITKLQELCQHHYINGCCEYCYSEEEK